MVLQNHLKIFKNSKFIRNMKWYIKIINFIIKSVIDIYILLFHAFPTVIQP